MNLQWQTFLTEQGAKFSTTNEILTFGHPEIERFLVKNGPIITSQAHQALLKVSGKESFDFLQGQLTNDLKNVNHETAQLSAYCDPKGNILTTFLVFKIADNFYLSFDFSLKDMIQKRLTMFVMRSKVAITDVADDLIHIGFAGDFAHLALQRLLSTKVKKDYQTAQLASESMSATVVKVPGPYHRYEIFATAEEMQLIWKKLKNNSDTTNSADWKLLDIVYGMPSLNSETQGKFIAQFFNLDKLEAISFKKGCFPGQEIIARIHYRGKVTKRMIRIHFSETVALQRGVDLILNDDDGKKFKLTIIEFNPDVIKGTLCLAIGTLRALESVSGQLKTELGITATIETLAYDLAKE